MTSELEHRNIILTNAYKTVPQKIENNWYTSDAHSGYSLGDIDQKNTDVDYDAKLNKNLFETRKELELQTKLVTELRDELKEQSKMSETLLRERNELKLRLIQKTIKSKTTILENNSKYKNEKIIHRQKDIDISEREFKEEDNKYNDANLTIPDELQKPFTEEKYKLQVDERIESMNKDIKSLTKKLGKQVDDIEYSQTIKALNDENDELKNKIHILEQKIEGRIMKAVKRNSCEATTTLEENICDLDNPKMLDGILEKIQKSLMNDKDAEMQNISISTLSNKLVKKLKNQIKIKMKKIMNDNRSLKKELVAKKLQLEILSKTVSEKKDELSGKTNSVADISKQLDEINEIEIKKLKH